MGRDILFLLRPAFPSEQGALQFCPDCMIVEGILATHPGLRDVLEVRYVDFPRPRQPIFDLTGPEQQGCPLLVRHCDGGMVATEDMVEILTWLHKTHAIPAARGRVTA
jgi:5,10-methenyltetrahydromethanopterin hydrogenase